MLLTSYAFDMGAKVTHCLSNLQLVMQLGSTCEPLADMTTMTRSIPPLLVHRYNDNCIVHPDKDKRGLLRCSQVRLNVFCRSA